MTHHSDTEISELIESLTGFTPGPWRSDGDDALPEIWGADGYAVATVDCLVRDDETRCEKKERTDEELQANARLIEAAPKLLSALQSLLADKARMEEGVNAIVDESVFSQQRFAEDSDSDYFLRCFRAVKDRARAALSTITPKEAE